MSLKRHIIKEVTKEIYNYTYDFSEDAEDYDDSQEQHTYLPRSYGDYIQIFDDSFESIDSGTLVKTTHNGVEIYRNKYKSGWTIVGSYEEDNTGQFFCSEFVASHIDKGFVKGDLNGIVKATNKQTFNDFFKNHPTTYEMINSF